MQNRPGKSVFLPKITQTIDSQALLIKKQEVIRSLQSEFIRNSFFYRSQDNKSSGTKRYKKSSNNLQPKHSLESHQPISFQGNRRRSNKKKYRRQKIHTDHSESVPINLKLKINSANFQSHRLPQSKDRLNLQDQKINENFCFYLLKDNKKNHYLSKHKKDKLKTDCKQLSYLELKTGRKDRRISDFLKIKKAERFEYSTPQVQRSQKEKNIRQCLNSLKKIKKRKDPFMLITSIKGWDSNLASTFEYFK